MADQFSGLSWRTRSKRETARLSFRRNDQPGGKMLGRSCSGISVLTIATASWKAQLCSEICSSVISTSVQHRLTRPSSATAGGDELSQHRELFHKIKSAHRTGQRLAAAIG